MTHEPDTRSEMAAFTIALDRSSPLGLQEQLRQKIVDAIYTGVLRAGSRMPSSRTLAGRLDVSRNTVVLAYADLVAEGHLESRERSGIFVSQAVRSGRVAGHRYQVGNVSALAERMATVPGDGGARCPANWRQYPYPFLDGRIDASLTPVAEWRRAIRMASNPRDAALWSDGNGELDDAMLVEEIRSKVLPERGISALPEEVLVLASARQGLQFLAALLVRPGTPVWLQEPVDAEFVATLRERGARIERFLAQAAPPEGVILVTSARHGIDGGARLRLSLLKAVARANGIVIEQDMPADVAESGAAETALYARAAAGSVIHLTRLAPAASCGTPPGVVVSDATVIARLRRLRRMSGAAPDPLQQRAWAYFLAMGHYAAALQRARRVLGARRMELRDALNHYLHTAVKIQTMPGTSAYWVRCRDGRDARALAVRAAGAGVLIQPARLDGAHDAFGMGVTSLPQQHIRAGVRMLARVFNADAAQPLRDRPAATPSTLSGPALRRAIAGKTLLYNTVYGEPCTIAVRRSGELVGLAGYAGDDPDRGRWWIDGDRWFRQWDHWAYGEAEGFRVAVEGDSLYWYDDAGHLVDKAVILHRGQRQAD